MNSATATRATQRLKLFSGALFNKKTVFRPGKSLPFMKDNGRRGKKGRLRMVGCETGLTLMMRINNNSFHKIVCKHGGYYRCQELQVQPLHVSAILGNGTRGERHADIENNRIRVKDPKESGT